MTSSDPGGSELTPRHQFATVASDTIYDGAIVRLRIDDVQMPGGNVAKREIVEHSGAVAVVAVGADDRIVLIDQYRHPVGRRLLELPAGLLDISGEDALVGAQRELVEEVGLAASSWSVLVDLALSPGFCDEVLRVYLATGLTEVERPDPEHEEADLQFVRMSIDEAVSAIFAGKIVNATTVAGILAFAAARGSKVALRDTGAPWPIAPNTTVGPNTTVDKGRS